MIRSAFVLIPENGAEVNLSRFTFISFYSMAAQLSHDKNNYKPEAVRKAQGTPLSHYNSFAAAMSGL